MHGMEILSAVEFTTARFWVKAYDVPGKKQTTSFARILASNIGTLVDCDESTLYRIDKALCFRVDIDIHKPLRRGMYVQVAGKTLWIRFKYVKLPDFCYGCGRLGHVLAAYDLVEAEEGHSNLQYGAWLRASPLKSRRRSAETELAEEKKVFSCLLYTSDAADE